MVSYRESRVEKAQSRRRKTKRLIVLILVALLLGVGSGVGVNLIFAEPPVEKENGRKESSSGTDTSATTPEEDSDTREEPGPLQFDIARAMKHAYALSEQIGVRQAGSMKASEAADYIVRKLGEYGYRVEDQPFKMPNGFSSRNIVGTRAGSREGYTMVVGAHYDSADNKGAVNNASGVSVVLELARLFADKRPQPNLKFVFFGANRPGISDMSERLLGSRNYVELLGSFEKKELVGMIAVDCVAQGAELELRTQETGLQRLKAKMETFARENDIATSAVKSATDSDNIPFEDAEVPAVWLEWCDPGGELVTDDSYNSIDASKVQAVGTLIEGFLSDLTPDDLKELRY